MIARIHAFELEDYSFLPNVIREAGMAYLRFAAENLNQARNMAPVVASTLTSSSQNQIFDLCSGGGGPAVAIANLLNKQGKIVSLTLSDLHPVKIKNDIDSSIQYLTESVNATDVNSTKNPKRQGLRTIFNAFHHFRPADATKLLASAVRDKQAILVVEVLQRRILSTLAIMATPLIVLLVLPFLRPFRWPWLIFTYVLPVIPLFIFWDGFISTLRIYKKAELLQMATEADPAESFRWQVLEIPLWPIPLPGIALQGIPKSLLNTP